MKNSLFAIAGLLIVIWSLLVWGFNFIGIVHLLLVVAAFIVLIRIIFSKQLSEKFKY